MSSPPTRAFGAVMCAGILISTEDKGFHAETLKVTLLMSYQKVMGQSGLPSK